jgi:hypothetical protein
MNETEIYILLFFSAYIKKAGNILFFFSKRFGKQYVCVVFCVGIVLANTGSNF